VQDHTLVSSIAPSGFGGDVVVADPIARNDSLIAYSGPNGTWADIMTQDSILDANDTTTYTVQSGDTLASISDLFDVSINTIRWQNDIPRGTQVKPGQQLIILPVDGVPHTVRKGDTLQSIATKYKGTVEEIQQFNDIDSTADLKVGMKLVIPNGEMPPEPKSVTKKSSGSKSRPAPSGRKELIIGDLVHPTAGRGIKTQGYHGRYNAIDIGIPIGSPLYATAGGTVVIANTSGWGGGYGKYVVIKHANGTQSLYGHMDSVSVTVGQSVAAGEGIGYSGNTGRSTGPHLHFEIRGGRIPW
jgi:murein DD-endopeptidase MepM/ murein hydrolase activator NlpD